MNKEIQKLPSFDISMEAFREYIYPDGKSFRVHRATTLILEKHRDGDRHRLIIEDPDGQYGMYVQPGWVAIKWTTPDKKHGITF